MIAYLDNSATTKPCERSVERMSVCMSDGYFNPSSLYAPAVEAERAMNACRDALLATIRANGFDALFTSGGTEANNLAILGFAAALRGKQHLITSAVEHPSVAACFDALEAQGHRVTRIPAGPNGALDLAALECALDAEPPALCSIMMVQNETGALHDLPGVSRLLRDKAPACRLHVDAVQGYLRLPLDARLFDMVAISAHKIHGPKGVGALLVRKGVRLLPRQIGGGQQNALRSGTENTPGIAGLLGAVEHMTSTMNAAADAMMRLKLRLASGIIAAIPDAQINGPAPESGAPHILNISFPGVRGEVLLHALEADGIYCSTGSACSSRKRKVSQVLLAMGVDPDRAESALRFSLCPDTTQQEIDFAIERIISHCALLRRFKRR